MPNKTAAESRHKGTFYCDQEPVLKFSNIEDYKQTQIYIDINLYMYLTI